MNKNTIVFLGIILAVISGWALFFGGDHEEDNTLFSAENSPSAAVEPVDAERFDELALDPGTFVLDVHIPEQTHIPGTDAFIPYNEIKSNEESLPQDNGTPILVYCRSGSMSREASEKLIDLGYDKVYDLVGGVNDYKQTRNKVVLSPDTRNLGTVIYGEVAATTFTLTNFTPEPLKITRVSTSCGCTSATIEKEGLEPYEEIPVNVSFDPAVHKDDTDLGDVTRIIYIDTDNPRFDQVTAEITAEVIKKERKE